MTTRFLKLVPFLTVICLFLNPLHSRADNDLKSKLEAIKFHINTYYAEQLTDPQKKDRKCFCQFGYGMYLFNAPLFPITGLVEPDGYGTHSYSQPGLKEHNGTMYTCKGGFIDMSHLRAGLDWTVFLTFKIVTEGKDFEVSDSGADMQLKFKNLKDLNLKDVASIAQKIAYERLVWHEIASWHYHPPNHTFNEKQSAFTPEDIYSDYLGTLIGKNIALRILNGYETKPFEEIATEEIQSTLFAYMPLSKKEGTMKAYDIVDLNKQNKLPELEQNKDVWWDSKVAFSDQRYIFKRYTEIGPKLSPWLVPNDNSIGCPAKQKPTVLSIPEKAHTGKSLYEYYTFRIAPDSSLFFANRTEKPLHPPFKAFNTQNMRDVVAFVSREMASELATGFNKRDQQNPEPKFKRLKKIVFK